MKSPLHKTIALLAFLVFSSSGLIAQTALTQGDIAFLGYNLDGVDDYAFILLKDVDASTQIHFTDCGWNDGVGFACNTGDATSWTWSSGGALTCGTVVNIAVNNPGFNASVGSVSGTTPVFSGLGDQLFAFQGTTGTPIFLAGMHSNESSTDANWSGSCTNNQTSALPDVLTNGVDAIRLHNGGAEVDNWQYNCSVVSGNVATVRAAINNVANWNNNNLTAFSPADPGCTWSITCVVAAPEIDIEGQSTSIADGDNTPSLGDDTDFGSVAIGATASNTFTIQNEGTSDLTLSGGPNFVTLSGSSLFTVTSQPSTNPIGASGSTTFQVQFSASCPNTAGNYTATVSVSSDDSDESPYTFDVRATITGVDTDSDGALDNCDSDDDNDGIADASDPDDFDFNVCGDSDADGCDDCSVTNDGFGALSDSDPNDDGTDSDCDGICDATDATDGASQTRGNMLTFDGGADYVSLGDIGELNFGKADDFTIEAWVNTAAGGDIDIISKYGGFSGAGWVFQHSSANNSLAFIMQGGFLDLFFAGPSGAPAIADGLWHHVAVSYDGSNGATGCTFYIDGVSYAGVAIGGLPGPVTGTVTNSNSATIGAYETPSVAEYWDGSMDEVRVWDDIRTQTEIRENIHLSLSGGCDASLDGYWKFNESSGTTAADLSGNGNDGTHMGAPSIVGSQCAVGLGVSTTHSMTANSTTYSSPACTSGYPMDLVFASTNPGGEVVVTCIFGNPVNPGPYVGDGSFHYWVVNNYGPTQSGLDGTMQFNYEDGHVATSTLTEYSLYKRGTRETGSWTETNTQADAASTTGGDNHIAFNGVSSFSQFWEVSKNDLSTLPVELTAFDASVINSNDVLLEWSTASEIDNKGFALQRSYDNVTWTEIGFVDGQGTKTTTTTYSFIDESAGTGVVYYRLKQVDFSGEFTHSGVRSVQLGFQLGDILLYPNPTEGSFTMSITDGTVLENAVVELIDPLGRIVERRVMNGSTGNFDIKDADAGIYMVSITNGDERTVLRLVVQ